MAFEIVDGMTGTKHIGSDDLAALNIATIGKADCVLKYGDDFKLTMASANSATLGTGVGMVGGKRFWNHAATSLTIQSGTQGQKRNDLIVARYAKTSAGIESITPVIIKGTPTTGTAADPEVTANDLKLWRVPLDGISVGEPVKLFEPVASLATLGDSVSPKYTSKTVVVPGWAGKVTTTLLSSNTLGIYAYIYTSSLSGAPWQNAVQPSFNTAGSDVWYINLGKACVSVGAHMRKFENICNLQSYDTSYYAKYGGALNPTFWIGADDMYAQVGPSSVWTTGPAILRISTVLRL